MLADPNVRHTLLLEVVTEARFICGSCLEEMEEPRVTSQGEIEIQPCECMGDSSRLAVNGPEFEDEE